MDGCLKNRVPHSIHTSRVYYISFSFVSSPKIIENSHKLIKITFSGCFFHDLLQPYLDIEETNFNVLLVHYWPPWFDGPQFLETGTEAKGLTQQFLNIGAIPLKVYKWKVNLVLLQFVLDTFRLFLIKLLQLSLQMCLTSTSVQSFELNI